MQITTATAPWDEETIAWNSSLPEQKACETWARFQKLVTEAVDLFNGGSINLAAQMLELAEQLQAENGLDSANADLVRNRLGFALDADRIRQCAEKADDRLALRASLSFFSAYAPDALLDELKSEPRRERRRWLLSLLVVHGETARAAAVVRLRESLEQAPDAEEWYFQRNLLHLLRRIPRTGEVSAEDEVAFAVHHSRLGLPTFVVREAVDLLGQIRDEGAERALISMLRELEGMLPTRASFAQTQDLPAVADRVAATLSAVPTWRAHVAIVDYAEETNMESGRALTALAGLGKQDLSKDDATVDRLIGLVACDRASDSSRRALAPRTEHDHEHMVPAIEALSGTPLPVVRRTLEQVVRRYSGKSSGKAAAKALEGFARRQGTVVSGSFGGPRLVHA